MLGLGIFSWFSYQHPLQQRLQMIKRVGFDAVSLWWGDEFGDKNCQPEMARKQGLDIDYVHAPCSNPNDLWIDGLNGDDYLRTILSCIDVTLSRRLLCTSPACPLNLKSHKSVWNESSGWWIPPRKTK